VQEGVRDLVRDGLVHSAHDCAEGGLAVAIAESCIAGRVGAKITLPDRVSAETLFGEAPSRVVVTVSEEQSAAARQRLEAAGIPVAELGDVRGDRLIINGTLDVPVDLLEATWERTIPEAVAL
jgi:phosphoribosylformylglycinamidine synthase subunit PurL